MTESTERMYRDTRRLLVEALEEGLRRADRDAASSGGYTRKALAYDLRARYQDVCEWMDLDGVKHPRIVHLAHFPRAFAEPVLALLARSHGYSLVDDRAAPASIVDVIAQLPKLLRATGNVNAGFAEAVVDAELSADERRDLLPRVRELIGLLRGIERMLVGDEGQGRKLEVAS